MLATTNIEWPLGRAHFDLYQEKGTVPHVLLGGTKYADHRNEQNFPIINHVYKDTPWP